MAASTAFAAQFEDAELGHRVASLRGRRVRHFDDASTATD
jgi:hypothetical protein